jgi:uncharacterized RDD family membrane protein YckC
MSNQQPQPGPGGEQEPNAEGAEGPGLPSAPPPDENAGRYDTPYGANPYGGAEGAADPLAGMPPLAPLGRRFLARFIDFLIVVIPAALILWLAMGDRDVNNNGSDGSSYIAQLIVLIGYFVYDAVMLSARGQTVGKMVMKIRVAMLDNGAVPHGNPAWFRAAVYSLVLLVPCIGSLFWLLNVLYCTWDKPYRQCLHDKVAKTVVVSAA